MARGLAAGSARTRQGSQTLGSHENGVKGRASEEPKDAIPLTAEGRQQFLARMAMTSAGWDDISMAMSVMRRWLMTNSIAPTHLNKDAVFNPAREQVGKIDWKAAFAEWAAAAESAAKAARERE